MLLSSLAADRNSRFFLSYHNPGTVAVESVKFRGRFIVMDLKKNKLRVDYPHDGNENFKIITLSNDSLFIALETFNGCYVAFDDYGEALDPCSQSIDNPATHFQFQIYSRSS